MTESPDVIWAKPDDSDGKPGEFKHKPSSAALFFFGFLESKHIRSGALLDIGCGNGRDSVFFSKKGFEVHALDISSVEGLERYGVKTHSASATEFWLFENHSFQFIMDVLCYCEEPDPDKQGFYRSELSRVLHPQGFFLISVPKAYGKERVAQEFAGFGIIVSQSSEDTVDLILSRK
jgi:SAM-dependent methyltransferase